MESLRPNDYTVTAYWLPDGDGGVSEVFLYQGEKYVDKVEKVMTYNRVLSEQTDADVLNYIEQRKKIAKFGKYVRERAVEAAGVLEPLNEAAAQPPHTEEPLAWMHGGETAAYSGGGTATDGTGMLATAEPSPTEKGTSGLSWNPDPIGDI